MKRIIFVRHGQAEDGTASFSDFERSLTQKGKNVSRQMAVKLREKIKEPGVIITSPAFRAIETALIFAGVYGIPADKMILYPKLYFVIDERSFMEMLMLVSDETDTVTLFGHNPTFTDIPDHFCRESVDSVAKSGIVSLTFEAKTWAAIKPDSGTKELFMKPKTTL